ncbi:MAG: hypothetical protein VYA71_00485 [Pseudomonadota bacterium]|nr:hypothetical protein [Pseudomonadota bacterium]
MTRRVRSVTLAQRRFTTRDTGKVRRIAQDPRACLSVSEAWVTFEVTVEILDDGGLELACRLAKLYYEPEPASRTIDVWTKAGNRVLLELTPTRIRSQHH